MVEKQLLHACLVDDDMREFAEPIGDILNRVCAFYFGAVLRARSPECGLVDPVGLIEQS